MPTAESSPQPKRFKAYIGGYLGMSYSVELSKGILTYTIFEQGYSNPTHEAITPTAAQWRVFRKTLDELQIWQWHVEYSDSGVCDGTQWCLEISYPDHALKSAGNNCYPDDGGTPNGSPEPTKSFRRYLGAVKKLTGGKTFA